MYFCLSLKLSPVGRGYNSDGWPSAKSVLLVLFSHWMKSSIWLYTYLAQRQMLDKSDITFAGRQRRLTLRQICHHICPRQMYNKCSINRTPYLYSDKYGVKQWCLNRYISFSPLIIECFFSFLMSGFEVLEQSCYVISTEKKSKRKYWINK